MVSEEPTAAQPHAINPVATPVVTPRQLAPIPTPEVRWRQPPVLALAALPGTALGRLGEPSTAPPAAWAAAGAAARMLHNAPLPPWPGRSPGEIASHLDGECEWLVTNGVLSAASSEPETNSDRAHAHIMPNKTRIGNNRTKYADSLDRQWLSGCERHGKHRIARVPELGITCMVKAVHLNLWLLARRRQVC
jgi:hypothetical protein